MSSFFCEEIPELEDLLGSYLKDLGASVPAELKEKIESIILGGGYGRAEGGVFKNSSGNLELYNDLDIFLFTPTPEDPKLIKWIKQVEHTGTDHLGIDVEIKALPKSELETNLQSMMFFDLVNGHYIIFGPNDYLEPYKPLYNAQNIHPEEATRLLWNRGSGLYFSKIKIEEKKDQSFIQRNQQKLKLALGDSIVCLKKGYHPSCQERHNFLENNAEDSELFRKILALHKEGVAFKIRPTHKDLSWEELEKENIALAQIWEETFKFIESRRLHAEFKTANEYVFSSKRSTQQVPLWKCLLINFRNKIKHKISLRPSWEYPRNTLFKVLICLLSSDKNLNQKIDKFIQNSSQKHPEKLYENLWTLYG